ncbi:MAG TPA: hypothetical protein VMX75_12200 [Spirochaetia bacterium]|nr:hypothetical protein [Spirochaetia bacterium]
MTRDDIAKAFEVDFGIDKRAVGSVIEDYIRRKIDHEQLNRKLREIILKQHSFHGGAGFRKAGR